jgi:uncharacterized membrane protein YqjE
MSDRTTRSRSSAGPGGFIGSLLALLSALVEFVETRAALVAHESKAAAIQFAILGICLVAALMLFAFGYIFLVASVIVGVAHLAKVSWLWTALAAAGVHFFLALVCLIIVRSKMTKPLFQATSAELKEDREWLRHLGTTTNRRPN